MLTQSGVKLLDFGLARFAANKAATGSSEAATQQKDLTKEQAIIGTLQYMAPEQVEGKSVDHHADIWALGALLYELITGDKAFAHESQAGLIHAILGVDPPPVSPPALDQIVSACLAKDRNERLQNAHDVALQLHWAASSDPSEVKRPTATRQAFLPIVALAVGALGAWALSRSREEPPHLLSPPWRQ